MLRVLSTELHQTRDFDAVATAIKNIIPSEVS